MVYPRSIKPAEDEFYLGRIDGSWEHVKINGVARLGEGNALLPV